MIGIDTNVLVRYIIQDDPKQSKEATNFIEKKCSEDSSLFISAIILCELVWVLESAYGYQREAIAQVLEQILKTRQFRLDEPEILWQSLHGYRNEGADFSDNYIAHLNKQRDCEYTITFDKGASKLHHFKLLP
jgi:predicted nucleic-acid-binding protein